MALDGHRETATPAPKDENCVSCVYEQNAEIEATARMLGERYDNDKVQEALKWKFPRHPKPCAHHAQTIGMPMDQTTRMRAVRVVQAPPANTGQVQSPRYQGAVSRPLNAGQPPEGHLLKGSLPSGDLRAIRESARNQWRLTGPLKPSESGKHEVPAWLVGATNSTPLFAKPQPMAIHKEKCPDCVSGTVYEPDGSFGPCAHCQGTGWVQPQPKPDASLVAERYRLMAPPADRAAPQPLAEQPQHTGAMPSVPAQPAQKLNSGEFPTLNAAMLRVMRGQAQLADILSAFRAEVMPWSHQYTNEALSLADNIRLAAEGLPREIELRLTGIENRLRLLAEYSEQVERDLRGLPQEWGRQHAS